jgi:TonB family protein
MKSVEQTRVDRRRLSLSFLLSLLLHAPLLSLTFGDQEQGLPGFGFPWQERRFEAPDLRVLLRPAPIPAVAAVGSGMPVEEPLPPASSEPPAAGEPDLTPTVFLVPVPVRIAETIVPEATPAVRAKRTAVAKPAPDAATGAVPETTPLMSEASADVAPTPVREVAVIALERSDEPAWVVPVPPPSPRSVSVSAPSAAVPATADAGEPEQKPAEPEVRERVVEVTKTDPPERQVLQQVDPLEAARLKAAQQDAARQEAVRQEAARIEAARIEAARLEAERREAARLAAAKLEAQRQEAARQAAARQQAARIEAARLDAERWEAERREAARLAAAKVDAQRNEAARQEAARIEAARLETERREAARLAAAKLEAQRQDAARQEAARSEAARLEAERLEAARLAAAKQEAQRLEAARQESARLEAARLAAERQEAVRQVAARQEAARVLEEQEEDARRDARRRAMGRQLDEEAARRDAAAAARTSSTLPLSLSTARRVRLWGRADANIELVNYAEAWARKIQLSTSVDTVRDMAKRPHTKPLVTVAVRSDGSVESVTFVVSSGVAEVDETIRRIVQSHVPYPAFPPALAREYDVVEIRRTWHFDMAIQLY